MPKLLVKLCLAVCLLSTSTFLSAHGPTRKKVTETIQINVPASEVWEIIGDFGSADVWLPMVTGIESEGGNEPKAKRTLILAPDVKVYEELKKHSDEKMSYTYKIPVKTHDVAILPVNNYSSTISVKDSGTGSIVTWKGAFYRGYPNNDPPAELNDDAAIAAVTGLYKAGLEHLKTLAESQ
ncbi:SRPBCC family protein [Granulosicoccus antarcticus]|uniref:MxaD protein n=1 Tax=Granulosicoccus antarcticus IMCC3135 TaxID=1192854 RepID=A0A2Z2NJG7_9GAMM|nr:SRPBCC family protein [Granulosicoccus antarcticus]ASJ70211.1 hypothetical protein IMCC3135_00425 [Granulosicoccus antarcticus IMCC3135]